MRSAMMIGAAAALAVNVATAGGSTDYPEPTMDRTPIGGVTSGQDIDALLGIGPGVDTSRRVDCARAQRVTQFTGEPTTIYVAKGQFTEVVLDQSIRAILADRNDGMRYQFDEGFADRIIFTITDALYESVVTLRVDGRRSVQLALEARPDCADSTVFVDNNSTAGAQRAKAAKVERSSNRLLIEYMWRGEVPTGYSVEDVEGDYAERLVYKQGSVHFYASEIWRGKNFTGVVLEAVNLGRTPFKIAVDAINYADPSLRSAFGNVSYVTMNPPDFRLGPAPEFAADAWHPTNRGLMYIVSDNASYTGGD